MLTAGKQPVDWPPLVKRQVVLIKTGGEIATDRFSRNCSLLVVGGTEAVGDEFQVLVQVFLRPHHTDEFHNAVGGIVPNSPVSFKKWYDTVVIRFEGFLGLAGIKALIGTIGINQAGPVQAEAAHGATDGIGDQPFDVFSQVGPVERDLVI